ncbi:MAG: hypothetical protein U5K69_16325 [Balneolaceae bacterium]|nr:hypothetical protein [Balneolaceae bacterium]
MSSNKNILLGYSGHAFVVAEAAGKAGISIDYYADKNKAVKNPLKLNYIGFEGDEGFEGWGKGFGFVLGVGDNNISTSLGNLVESSKRAIIDSYYIRQLRFRIVLPLVPELLFLPM